MDIHAIRLVYDKIGQHLFPGDDLPLGTCAVTGLTGVPVSTFEDGRTVVSWIKALSASSPLLGKKSEKQGLNRNLASGNEIGILIDAERAILYLSKPYLESGAVTDHGHFEVRPHPGEQQLMIEAVARPPMAPYVFLPKGSDKKADRLASGLRLGDAQAEAIGLLVCSGRPASCFSIARMRQILASAEGIPCGTRPKSIPTEAADIVSLADATALARSALIDLRPLADKVLRAVLRDSAHPVRGFLDSFASSLRSPEGEFLEKRVLDKFFTPASRHEPFSLGKIAA